ncbi:hypothetical protein D3C81_1018520 [compost metagenome]
MAVIGFAVLLTISAIQVIVVAKCMVMTTKYIEFIHPVIEGHMLQLLRADTISKGTCYTSIQALQLIFLRFDIDNTSCTACIIFSRGTIDNFDGSEVIR